MGCDLLVSLSSLAMCFERVKKGKLAFAVAGGGFMGESRDGLG
jgi:hypothetical protein